MEGSPRYHEIVETARDLLEDGGSAALTMRAVADSLGIKAPSLYKHVPNKEALELAIIVDGLTQAAETFERACADADDPLAAYAEAYRSFATAHPHLYRLMTDRPLPRESMPPGLLDRTAAPLIRATGDAVRARAAWGYLHGMVMLGLNRRFPDDGLTTAAWQAGIVAFQPLGTATQRS